MIVYRLALLMLTSTIDVLQICRQTKCSGGTAPPSPSHGCAPALYPVYLESNTKGICEFPLISSCIKDLLHSKQLMGHFSFFLDSFSNGMKFNNLCESKAVSLCALYQRV